MIAATLIPFGNDKQEEEYYRRTSALEQNPSNSAYGRIVKGGFYFHPTDEDPSLHPNEQTSLVGDPGSVGAPVRKKPLDGCAIGYVYSDSAVPFAYCGGRGEFDMMPGFRCAR